MAVVHVHATRVCMHHEPPWGLSLLKLRLTALPRGIEDGKMWPKTGSELKFTRDSLTLLLVNTAGRYSRAIRRNWTDIQAIISLLP